MTATRTAGNATESSPTRVTTSRLCLRLAFSTTSAPMKRARTQADDAADREVAREAPPTRDERGDHDEAERPERAERVEQAEERVEVVRAAR